jgi:large subunit ribosomal protein L9
MKVLLIQDVYNLGRAGDVKKVANGYGRNFLLPQGLAVLATTGALKQVDRIRVQADEKRTVLNEEMSIVAEKLADIKLTFPVKASETGKLYGSVTPQMIIDSINQEAGVEITRRQVDAQPIRFIGVHQVKIRLTIDQIPQVTLVVHREGEAPETAELEPEMEPGTEGKLSIADVVVEIEPEVEDGLEIASQLAAAQGQAELELEVASQPVEAGAVAEIETEFEDGLAVAEAEVEVEPEAVEADLEAETEPVPSEEELEAVPDPEETEEDTAS